MHPWLAAQMRKHLKMTSTIRWEVSTFPAHTAASKLGRKSDPSGMMIFTGLMQPWLRGMSEFTMQRRAKITAELQIAIGAFQFPVVD
jgi:hypothetical protein